MAKRARFQFSVGGRDITGVVTPLLLSLSVNLKVGTHADTAQIELDDTDGRVLLPPPGATCRIALGWEGSAGTYAFEGTVDSVRSSGGSSGRTLSLTATAVDMRGRAKEPQSRHFDNETIEGALRQVAEAAGLTRIEVDPALGSLRRVYMVLQDESLIGFGERIAREIGGHFRIVGDRVVMTKRSGSFTGAVTAAWGDNLHSWSITPDRGRPAVNKASARFYDWNIGDWDIVERATALGDGITAGAVSRFLRGNREEAEQQAGADAETSDRDRGGGNVVIEGNPSAQPDQLCIVTGARPGVDGAYRIEAVAHSLNASGFTTSLTLKRPTKEGGGSGGESLPSDEREENVITRLADRFRAENPSGPQ